MSQLKPSSTNLDMRAYYEVPLGDFRLVAFARVFNVLDTRNEDDVWNDTGRAGYTTYEEQARQTNPSESINTLSQWYTIPTYYSEPRRIELGLNLEF
jgi:hypothetical protein